METFDAETLKTLAALERMAEPASSDATETDEGAFFIGTCHPPAAPPSDDDSIEASTNVFTPSELNAISLLGHSVVLGHHDEHDAGTIVDETTDAVTGKKSVCVYMPPGTLSSDWGRRAFAEGFSPELSLQHHWSIVGDATKGTLRLAKVPTHVGIVIEGNRAGCTVPWVTTHKMTPEQRDVMHEHTRALRGVASKRAIEHIRSYSGAACRDFSYAKFLAANEARGDGARAAGVVSASAGVAQPALAAIVDRLLQAQTSDAFCVAGNISSAPPPPPTTARDTRMEPQTNNNTEDDATAASAAAADDASTIDGADEILGLDSALTASDAAANMLVKMVPHTAALKRKNDDLTRANEQQAGELAALKARLEKALAAAVAVPAAAAAAPVVPSASARIAANTWLKAAELAGIDPDLARCASEGNGEMGKAAETLILHGIMSNAAAYKKQAEEVGAQVKSALLRHGDERAPKTRKLTVDEALAKGSALLTKTALPSNRNDSTPPPPSSSSSNVASPQPQPAPRMTPTQMTPDMFAKRMQQSLQPQQTQQTQQMPTTRGMPTTSVWDAETANMRAGLIQFAKDSGPITSMVELANAHNMQVFSAKTGASRAMA